MLGNFDVAMIGNLPCSLDTFVVLQIVEGEGAGHQRVTCGRDFGDAKY